MKLFLPVNAHIAMMSSENRDEIEDRGDVSQQEQYKIEEDAENPIKRGQTERRAPKDRGEAVQQEQERIIEEAETELKNPERRAPKDRGEAVQQEQERIIEEAEAEK
jgi:hypothetical protein